MVTLANGGAWLVNGAEIIADADNWAAGCYDGQYTGDYFAEHGYVVLSIDALFWGERGRKEGVNYDGQQALASNFLQMGSSWGAFINMDDVRSAWPPCHLWIKIK